MAPGATAIRWMWVWITIAALVVLVVIGFLFGIAGSLESIDSGLQEANTSVAGANGDVRPLPAHIEDINGNLGHVDVALKPLRGQADQIITELGGIRSTLTRVNGSLTSTSGSLVDTSGTLADTSGTLARTSGSLVDTSRTLADTERILSGTSGTLMTAEGALTTTRKLIRQIHDVLVVAQIFNSKGTNGIWRRVRFLNGFALFEPGDVRRFGVGVGSQPPGARAGSSGMPLHLDNTKGLRFVEGDASRIFGGLTQVSRHLTSICEALPPGLNLVPGAGGGGGGGALPPPVGSGGGSPGVTPSPTRPQPTTGPC